MSLGSDIRFAHDQTIFQKNAIVATSPGSTRRAFAMRSRQVGQAGLGGQSVDLVEVRREQTLCFRRVARSPVIQVERMIVEADSPARLLHFFLLLATRLSLSDRRVARLFCGDGLSVKIRQRARVWALLATGVGLGQACRERLVRRVESAVGLPHARRQRTGTRPRQLLLNVKHVRRMMGLKTVSGMSLQSGRLIADRLDDRHRQSVECRLQARIPGRRVSLIAIALQQDEPRNRFDGHQTDLGMKRLILANRDLPLGHLRSQLLLLGAGILVDQFGDAGGIRLLTAERTGDDTIQLSEFQEATEMPQAAMAVVLKDQMQREHNLPQALDSDRAFPKAGEFGRQGELLSSLDPELQRRPRQISLFGELSLRDFGSAAIPLLQSPSDLFA